MCLLEGASMFVHPSNEAFQMSLAASSEPHHTSSSPSVYLAKYHDPGAAVGQRVEQVD